MKLVSLYEYLGHAAGPELGQKVNKAAQQQRIYYSAKDLDHPTYKGKIMIYPETFLDDYFGKSADKDKPVRGWEDVEDDLPF